MPLHCNFTGMSAAAPLPVAAPSAASVPAGQGAVSPELQRALDESLRLDLFAANPGRLLGVFPVYPPTVLKDRIQALTGAGAPAGWAFAPDLPLSPEQVRGVARSAADPAGRLLAELFWFWPESYPDNKPDAALAALAAGDAEKAYGRWLAADGRGHAAHNMAVMFHFAALGRELERGPLDEEARAWWTAAAEQWTATLAAEDFWASWAARCTQEGFGTAEAALVRATLPRLLGALSLLAAAERARRGELAEARWLREFAVRRLADQPLFECTLSSALAGEARRAEEALAAAEERLTADGEPCLPHVAELLRLVAGHRRVLEAVAGADSAPLRRLGTRVVEVGLAGLAEHARRTGDDAAVLPWLLHLASWPAEPEQRRRAAADAGAVWAKLAAAMLAAGSGAPASRHEATLRICAETLVPAVEQFAWDDRVKAAYRQRVAQRLRDLAREAWLELGEFEVTAQACVLAAELLDEESSALVVRERRQLWQQFQRAQNGVLTLEFNGAHLEIDSRRLRLDAREWPIATLNGLRFGVGEGLGGHGPQIAWYAGRDAVVLDAVTWFDPVDGGAERFRQVVEALDACVIPALAARIVERVRSGQSVVFGQSALRPEGFVFQRRPGQLAPAEVVPYARLTQRVEGGELVLGQLDDPAAAAHFPLATTWNAVAMAEVLTRLSETE